MTVWERERLTNEGEVFIMAPLGNLFPSYCSDVISNRILVICYLSNTVWVFTWSRTHLTFCCSSVYDLSAPSQCYPRIPSWKRASILSLAAFVTSCLCDGRPERHFLREEGFWCVGQGCGTIQHGCEVGMAQGWTAGADGSGSDTWSVNNHRASEGSRAWLYPTAASCIHPLPPERPSLQKVHNLPKQHHQQGARGSAERFTCKQKHLSVDIWIVTNLKNMNQQFYSQYGPTSLGGISMFHVMALSLWRDTIPSLYRESVFLGGVLPRHKPTCVILLNGNNQSPEGNRKMPNRVLPGLWAVLPTTASASPGLWDWPLFSSTWDLRVPRGGLEFP